MAWEHFPHGADIGVRGTGATRDEAFEQAALAVTAVIADPAQIAADTVVEIRCEAPDDELLLADWLNALIYEMATRHMLFGRFAVSLRRPCARGESLGRAGRSPRGIGPPSKSRGRPTRRCPWRGAATARGSRSASSTCEGGNAMDPGRLKRIGDCEWQLPQTGAMRVPGVIYADEALVRAMDDKVPEQVANVATLPGIVKASFAMPDAHWGYGFPIGGVAAFDPDEGGVVSAGGVGFDISCGVRTLLTGLTRAQVEPVKRRLADTLAERIPAGVGSTGALRLAADEMDAMLRGGARWAVERGYGRPEDLERIEERGVMAGAEPGSVSAAAKRRQRDEMGTLGSGNHYLEVQHVVEVYDGADRRGVRARRGRRRRQHPLRVARPGPPDRHGIPARDGDHGRCGGHRAPRPRARLRADSIGGGRALSRRDARGDQLRAGEPADPHAPDARRIRRGAARHEARAALRRVAQHLQGRAARRRRQAARALRPSQRGDPRLRPGTSRPSARACRRPASRC